MSKKQVVPSLTSQDTPYPKFQSGLKKTLNGHISKHENQWNAQPHSNSYKSPVFTMPKKQTPHPISNPFFHGQPNSQGISNIRAFLPSTANKSSGKSNHNNNYLPSKDETKRKEEIEEIDVELRKKTKPIKEKIAVQNPSTTTKIETREEKLAKLRGRSFFRSSFKPNPTETFNQILTSQNAPEGFKPFQSPLQNFYTKPGPAMSHQQNLAMLQAFMQQMQFHQNMQYNPMDGAGSHHQNDQNSYKHQGQPFIKQDRNTIPRNTSTFNKLDRSNIEKKIQDGGKKIKNAWNHLLNTKKSVLMKIEELSEYLFLSSDPLSYEATLQLLRRNPIYFNLVSSTEFECHSVREVERIENEQNQGLKDEFMRKSTLAAVASILSTRCESPSQKLSKEKLDSIVKRESVQVQKLKEKLEKEKIDHEIVVRPQFDMKNQLIRDLKLYALGISTNSTSNMGVQKYLLDPLGLENNSCIAFQLCKDLDLFNSNNIPLLKMMVVHGDAFKTTFPEPVLEEAKSIKENFEILPDPDEKHRKDFRDLVAFAIDDENSLEIDDAISVHQSGDKFSVFIHISDATKYIDAKGTVNASALERVSSIYLPDSQIPMLPNELGVDILSLSADRENDVLTFTATINKDGELEDCNVVPGRLSRVNRLTYDDFDQLLKNPKETSTLTNLFLEVANIRLRHRLKRGAQNSLLGAEEISPFLIVDEKNDKIQLKPKISSKYSRRIVEEFMIIANEVSAKFASQNDIVIPYRGTRGQKKEARLLSEEEISKIIHTKQIDTVNDMVDRVQEIGLRATTTHTSAAMFSTPHPHHALGVSAYTFATSPLRRYVDLLVHHQIKNWLRGHATLSWEEIQQHLNRVEPKQRQIFSLQKDSVYFWTLKYFEKNRGATFPGIIYGIDSVVSDTNSDNVEPSMLVDILLPDQGFHTKVHVQRDIRIGELVKVQCVHASASTSSLRFVEVF